MKISSDRNLDLVNLSIYSTEYYRYIYSGVSVMILVLVLILMEILSIAAAENLYYCCPALERIEKIVLSLPIGIAQTILNTTPVPLVRMELLPRNLQLLNPPPSPFHPAVALPLRLPLLLLFRLQKWLVHFCCLLLWKKL
jgi:hypothetical protein